MTPRRCLRKTFTKPRLDLPPAGAGPSFRNYYSIDEGGPFYDRYRTRRARVYLCAKLPAVYTLAADRCLMGGGV